MLRSMLNIRETSQKRERDKEKEKRGKKGWEEREEGR